MADAMAERDRRQREREPEDAQHRRGDGHEKDGVHASLGSRDRRHHRSHLRHHRDRHHHGQHQHHHHRSSQRDHRDVPPGSSSSPSPATMVMMTPMPPVAVANDTSPVEPEGGAHWTADTTGAGVVMGSKAEVSTGDGAASARGRATKPPGASREEEGQEGRGWPAIRAEDDVPSYPVSQGLPAPGPVAIVTVVVEVS